MTRITTTLAITSITAALAAAPAAHAIDYSWNVLGGGAQTWQTAANWSPNANFPNGIEHVASFAVPLTGNLNASIGATDVTIGGLNIGSTGAAVTTEISGTGGKIIFSNNDDPDFDNDNDIDGHDLMIWQTGLGVGTTNAAGDANGDGQVDAADLRPWRQFYAAGGTNATAVPPAYVGRPTINSVGVSGATNIISAPVRIGVALDATTFRTETVDLQGTNSLNLAGGIRLAGNGNSLTSFLPASATLTIGPIVLEEDTEAPPTTNRAFNLGNTTAVAARYELVGLISGGGDLNLGTSGGGGQIPTFVISGNNTNTGQTLMNRSNIVLAHNNALGDAAMNATLRGGNPSNNLGFNLISDDDARTIAARHSMAQFTTINGEHSLTWTGLTSQTNARGYVNLLPAGKTFTHTGKVYGVSNTDTARVFTWDGTGTTIVTGVVAGNRYVFTNNLGEEPLSESIITSHTKAGSGAVYFNGGQTYTGPTTVNGGNLHFAQYDINTTSTPPTRIHFGAVGVDTGVLSNFYFLAGVAASLAPTATAPNSTGGIMIDDSEAGAATTFDFTTGDLGTVTTNGARLSLAAPETGLTFTGSIVPDNSTYRLGGGTGTLTLPNAQLTGANNLIATNGGVVQLNGSNTYSGTTSAIAKYTSSLTAAALVNGATGTGSLNRVYGGTVLAVQHLANGGSPSSMGSSSSAAANLVIQGSTLRYTGSGATTDRLFTVGTGGATVESSGSGAVSFTNAGSLAMDEPESRTATTIATNSGALSGLATFDDLVAGMGVSGANIAANTTISTNVAVPVDASLNSLTMSANAAVVGTGPVTFTSIARTLTLGGTNTGANTLRPIIANGAAATSVVKAGAGTWILTGANTYTGTTTVNQGTLLVNGVHTGGGAYTVAAGATLGGTGTAGGALTANGVVSPGASAGALTVSGAGTFNAGSTLLVEIGGNLAGQFDELNLTGALTAGGTFDVDFIGGYAGVAGHSFDVLDFTSATGSFTLSLPALGGGMTWNTSALLTTGTISILGAGAGAAVPEPSSVMLAALGMVALAARRRK